MRGDRGGVGAGEARAAAGDTFSLIKRYVIQETFGPLKHILRMLAFGLSGALLLGIGSSIVLLGVLRVLQTETGTTFGGNWSFAPFLLSALVALLAAAGATYVGLKGVRRKPDDKGERV
jgi:hypothetical protein